jgi:chromosome segregation ATPase
MRSIFYDSWVLVLSVGIVGCSTPQVERPTSPPLTLNPQPDYIGKPHGPATLQDSLHQLGLRVKDMEAELGRANQGIQGQRKAQLKLKNEAKQLGRLLAADQKKLQERQVQLDKIRRETHELDVLREQQAAMKIDFEKKHAEITQQSHPAETQLAEAKAKYETTLRDTDSAKRKLEKTRDEQAKIAAGIEAQLGKFNERLRENREKTVAVENEIRLGRQKIQSLEEQVRDSESEVKITDARLIDGQGRLKEMNLRASPKEADLNKRLQAADEHLNDRAVGETKMKIDRAQVDQLLERKPASDQPVIGLQLRRKVASNSMKTRRNCQIYKRPNLKAKVVGSKRAGSMVSGQAENNWMVLALPNGTTGFVPLGCFDARL